MFLQVRDHLAPWSETTEFPGYLNENVICANELADQRVEGFASNRPISLKHAYPIQRD